MRTIGMLAALVLMTGCDPGRPLPVRGGDAGAPPASGVPAVSEATPDEIRGYFAAKHVQVLTFVGYSGAGYEDERAMLDEATRVLAGFDPRRTIVNIGATPDGIGAVYAVAKAKGFPTTGIVSTQARKQGARLSPHVDVVFYVRDATWGGRDPVTHALSPTSRAMVESSDVVVAIGGGDVARDELEAAERAGKRVRFVPADMSHEIARAKARKAGKPAPTDFRSPARTVLE
jgi:hypothetical protein